MTISFWRYSHLLLAGTSALFLIIASVTGVILACEPISNESQSYAVVNLEEVSTATTITALKKEYEEVLSLKVTASDEVIASVITAAGNSEDIYVNPLSGHRLGTVEDRHPLFIWTTNLHRSLFLKSLGRIFVGVVSFLLCLIALTGLLLLIQRQGGVLKLYSKVKERDFNQRYHVILGRWLLIPIVIIAATGVYLSLEKFDLIPVTHTELDWSKEPVQEFHSTDLTSIPFFKELKLADVRQISFPFSEDEYDYYEFHLQSRDLLIHQYSGEIISEVQLPFSFFLSQWSFNLHTGTGSLLWSLILLISSASILFFIFSGFVMYLKRRRKSKTIKTSIDKDDSELVILVGSESGNTYAFANAITQQLTSQGKPVYVSTLNEYTSYKKATQLLVLTATYGDGDAPTNARHFLNLLPTIKQPNPIEFAVLGFGSMNYPYFCEYAIQVDARLNESDGFTPLLALEKINEQSDSEMNAWLEKWSHAIGITYNRHISNKKEIEYENITVIERTALNLDDTFLLRLRIPKNQPFQSGDILQIKAPETEQPRAYSIARIGDDILLSIKKHDKGICSSFLSHLNSGDQIEAYIEENKHFHLSSDSDTTIFISNGTGVAPFLGMINDQRKSSQELYFFWGGRFKESFDLYDPLVQMAADQLSTLQLTYSRELQKNYVQDEIWKNRELIATRLDHGAQVMICGSIAMRDDVLAVLEKITAAENKKPLTYYESNGQILMDCY
ncbi:PepSY domain-containing protein [Nonlabens mediterrranea]|uniref:NADPH--hemoprotein reductase n=1 Tax=Nonlabens mediterrranea TaxID=1419947 RepID=A0ABS0A0V1_9FLAO|nr:PepSY domain-containing protein [Nonlabens mediterrranea]